MQARASLLAIEHALLSGPTIKSWFVQHQTIFAQAESLCGTLINYNIANNYMNGFWNEADGEVVTACRDRILRLLDSTIQALDVQQEVRPVLDDLILRVQNEKLHRLLVEFNAIREVQCNIAGIGFRTILALIIQERARVVDSESWIAQADDFNSFEKAIKYALNRANLFDSAAQKHLRRYLEGTLKDSLDNVAHKSDYLIEPDDLSLAVDLLNKLLPSIVVQS